MIKTLFYTVLPRVAGRDDVNTVYFADNMKKATPVKELNAILVGSKSSRTYLVGNIILGKQAFDPEDITSRCERGEGEVGGRSVALVRAPGWLRGYRLCNTSEVFKTEAILSVKRCPPGLHGLILVINAELPFKKEYKTATYEHLQHFFGEQVWDHTIVVFSHRGHLGHKTIEDYIGREGAPLQSVLEACGNRYHVLCDDGTDNDVKVRELFDKIDAMVTANGFYEADSTKIQAVESKRKEVDKKAEELRLQSQQQKQKLRSLLTEPTPNLRILMLGWVFSGKSAAGNRILRAEVFQSGDRTVSALKQSGEVAGREVIIVDTPGWWKFFPAAFTPLTLKSEILKGVSLCSPSPNVILLAVPLDTSFTDRQRRVTEGNMRIFGENVWRHVIVLFTFGESLGDMDIEQHIESEGKDLRWLIDKCGHRYHVINNMSTTDEQVTDLLEKMEEMVAGNSFFYLRATDEPQPEEGRSDQSTASKDENPTKKITKQLLVAWDHRWEKHHAGSMGIPPSISDEKQESDSSEGEEVHMEHRHEEDQFMTSFGLEEESDDDAGCSPLRRWMGLLEKEWRRREVSMEQAAWKHFYGPVEIALSEPDNDQLLKSTEKVTSWLVKHQPTSGYGSVLSSKWEEENQN